MEFLWAIAKKILFRCDPERIHDLAIFALKIFGALPRCRIQLNEGTLTPTGSGAILGAQFRSRVGLAAGFDKDAEALLGLERLGFGYVEIGTVTPRPQPGNPKPRLFRDPPHETLLNRMGFNNLGAQAAAERLRRARTRLPNGFCVGVNIGKNKDTPLEEAHLDYQRAIMPFEGLCDYVVINVSSPNTPGLRSLQSEESLKKILKAVLDPVSKWKKSVSVLLKLAPEVEGENLCHLIQNLEAEGVGGWVLTNTLGGELPNRGSGGLSGGCLTERSRKRLVDARSVSRLPIISVGGIMSTQEAVERCRLGADLIQIYSGWIYRGPQFVGALLRDLRQAGF